MFCIKCGKTLEPSAVACPDCGTNVNGADGFDLHKITEPDIEMLSGEKTVAADYGALARKAAAAANANTAAEATAFASAASSVMQDNVPHSPAGFDLKNVKKTMNGRSILIDDSPFPGTVPAYLAPPVQAAPPLVPQAQRAADDSSSGKPQNKTAVILIIAAAVLAVALIAGVLFFVINNKDKDEREPSAVTEYRTDGESEKLDKSDFTSTETANGILIDNYTDIFIDEDVNSGRPEMTEPAYGDEITGTRPAGPGSSITPNGFVITDEPVNSEQDLSDFLNDESETAPDTDSDNGGEKDEEVLNSEYSASAENAR